MEDTPTSTFFIPLKFEENQLYAYICNFCVDLGILFVLLWMHTKCTCEIMDRSWTWTAVDFVLVSNQNSFEILANNSQILDSYDKSRYPVTGKRVN